MSLLDTGFETVVVFAEETVTDPDGNPVRRPAGLGVSVRAHVQPVTQAEDVTVGQGSDTRYRVIARDAPLGAWARVDWRGESYEVLGEPARRPGPAHLAHVTAIIRRS
jgi:hypothetical protein